MENNEHVETTQEQKQSIGASLTTMAVSLATEIGVGVIFSAITGKALEGVNMNRVEKTCARVACGIMGGATAKACDGFISDKVNGIWNAASKIGALFKELHENQESTTKEG